MWVWARLGLLVGAGGLGCEGSSRLHSPRPRVVRDAGGTIAQSHAASGAPAHPDRVGPAVGSIGWAAGAAGQPMDASSRLRCPLRAVPVLRARSPGQRSSGKPSWLSRTLHLSGFREEFQAASWGVDRREAEHDSPFMKNEPL